MVLAGYAHGAVEMPLAQIGAVADPLPDAATSARQVHVEQRITIRVAPGPVMPFNPVMPMRPPEPDPRRLARPIGRCVPAAAIVGVISDGSHVLSLMLRDGRRLDALLDKVCRAQDFYSGFYIERNADGQVCINRDRLRARSGTDCHIRGWSQR
ncbi:hypothetical protein GTZ99_03385 [Novosphingobium sp. FSY-8]|uniref:Uncharacterized protein n=1 Tax=Novosphingobium ovatum TaxID=1908523 RepID=A0ABW9XAR9_9SPHN|nr:hypothetical protein [Novosphingobium ovatum]NBC35595.1 hypothetical protein [Novosphingobium ovatum]